MRRAHEEFFGKDYSSIGKFTAAVTRELDEHILKYSYGTEDLPPREWRVSGSSKPPSGPRRLRDGPEMNGCILDTLFSSCRCRIGARWQADQSSPLLCPVVSCRFPRAMFCAASCQTGQEEA